VEGSDNSEDDECVSPHCSGPLLIHSAHILCTFRDLTDLSYVTNGSYSDGDHAFYIASLASQSEALGFGTPLHQKRRGAFR
jgi:hypothetical protein